MARKWEKIADVPVKAWFRSLTRRGDIAQIKGINLQYVPMGMVATAPGEAVEIANTFWRVQELVAVYDYSFDLEHWYPCEGDWPDTGDVDKLASYVAGELKRQRELTDAAVDAMRGAIEKVNGLSDNADQMAIQIRDLKEEFGALSITVMNIKAGCKPEPEAKPAPAAAKGATPPK